MLNGQTFHNGFDHQIHSCQVAELRNSLQTLGGSLSRINRELSLGGQLVKLRTQAVNRGLGGIWSVVEQQNPVPRHRSHLRNARTHRAGTDHCHEGVFGKSLGHHISFQ